MAVVQEFRYRAVDPHGGAVVKGTIEAASESAVGAKLRAQGLTPLDVVAVSKSGLNMEIRIPGFTKHVSSKNLAIFAKQMSGLINAGLPLMRTLSILIEQTEDKRLQPALVGVHADVEAGSSLSAAMARHPEVFPPLMLSIVRVGETGGFLGSALASIAENYRKEAELQNKIRAAVTYPTIVLIIAMLGVLAMITFIVPVFESMFSSLGSQLPLPTQILVVLSKNMVWILPLLLIVVSAVWIWWMRNRHTERVRKVVDPIRLKMPIFGPVATKMAVARFSRNLSMMLDAGVPIIQALSIVGQASNNWKVEQAVHDVQESIRAGKSFAVPLAKAEVFPAMVPQMVSVGEESGTLVEMLSSIADFYEDEVETATSQLSATIEPVLIVGLGVVIGGMVISLYLPIFSLYSELSKQ
ncbi:type II secretion system F family protein [Microbacterium thalassium]|uniref:Type IV pilus assembly protein PilC n=1 Tax=Microbacterium thalassium TaxID=362649 RepID=A0A7X0KV21_9MICO|nr:type II secretion system F family protein [Microbacterium thalassium]MBB6391639.1 type IV pilus assembly protein PilC [Microbacterium thalassium]GLK24242.1 type II secretion system protein F [Microbacterium thalassium]